MSTWYSIVRNVAATVSQPVFCHTPLSGLIITFEGGFGGLTALGSKALSPWTSPVNVPPLWKTVRINKLSLGVSYEPRPGRVIDFMLSVNVIPFLGENHRRCDRERQNQREQPNETFIAPAVIEIVKIRRNFFHAEF